MDYIERIFGVSPDGGDGSLERLYLLCLLSAIALLIGALSRQARRRERMPPPVVPGQTPGTRTRARLGWRDGWR